MSSESHNKRKEKRRKKKQRQQGSPGKARGTRGASGGDRPLLDPERPDLCGSPVHVAPDLSVIEDPVEVLGLTAEESSNPTRVRAAFKMAIEAHPPEREPDLARRLREARDRLIDPARELERILGILHLPDPVAHGLPGADSSEPKPPDRLPAHARLLGQLALYALLEDEIDGGSTEA